MKYYIERTIGNFRDTMSQLWEGNDLPTFRRDGNPYCFTDHKAAQQVLWRLQAKYPMTLEVPTTGFTTQGKPLLPSLPITYTLEAIGVSQ
jgi:hypothetical protein